MSQHTLTITIVFEAPDDGARDERACQHEDTVSAIESCVNDMLDDGTIQDWLLDAASDHDNFDDDTTTVSASCTMEATKRE